MILIYQYKNIQYSYNIQKQKMSYYSFQSNFMIFPLMNVQWSFLSNQQAFFTKYQSVSNSFDMIYWQKTQQLPTQYASNILPIPSHPPQPVQTYPIILQNQQNFQRQTINRKPLNQIRSAKKNSQSNIINQFYSFFSNKLKTQRIVKKCAQVIKKSPQEIQKIISIFYITIKFINSKRGRKYVNMAMLLRFFTYESFCQQLGQIKHRIQQLNFLTVDQLCQVFRKCAKYFFTLNQYQCHIGFQTYLDHFQIRTPKKKKKNITNDWQSMIYLFIKKTNFNYSSNQN